MRILAWLALVIAFVDALRLPATCTPRAGVLRACAEPAAATAATSAAAATADGAESAAEEETEWKDPLGDGDFVRWYRMEKAKEAYLKENPIDPLATLGDKLGPILTSVAILLGGFYAIPLIKGISAGVQSGDFVGSLGAALSAPVETGSKALSDLGI